MFVKCVHVVSSDSNYFSDSVNSECQILAQQYPCFPITVQYSTNTVTNGNFSELVFSALIVVSD